MPEHLTEITVSNYRDKLQTYLTEPVAEGAKVREQWRCRECGEAIKLDDMPVWHACGGG